MANVSLMFRLYICLTSLVNIASQPLKCASECQCRFYPRRPVMCAYSPGLSSFPTSMPNVTISVSMSGTYLQHNHFGHLQQSYFSNLQSLQHLSLPFSEISVIQDGTFSNLSMLGLNLRNNELKRISSKTFEGLRKIYSIDLTSNFGCVIDDDAFSSLSSLIELFLGNMELKRIPYKLDTLSNLKYLYLHDNLITFFNGSMLQHLQKLKILDLSRNLITTFSSSMRNLILKIHDFNILGNPLHCNCESKWLNTLPIRHLYNTDVDEPLVCASPESLRFTAVIDVSSSDFMCIPPRIITCGGSKYYATYGENLTISCIIEADPAPSVKLVNPKGEDVVSENASNFNLLNQTSVVDLNIRLTSQADNGVWTLQVSNINGTSSTELSIVLTMPTTTSKVRHTSPVTTLQIRNTNPSTAFQFRNQSTVSRLWNTSPISTFGLRNTSQSTTSRPRNTSLITTFWFKNTRQSPISSTAVQFRNQSTVSWLWNTSLISTFGLRNTSQSTTSRPRNTSLITTVWFKNTRQSPISTIRITSKPKNSNAYVIGIPIGVGVAFVVCSLVLAYTVYKRYKKRSLVNPESIEN